MTQPQQLAFAIAKAEYLLTRVAEPGQGRDKQKFWQNILGFESAEALREAILKEVTVELLEPLGANEFGERYAASIQITGANQITKAVRTIWIVRFNEDIARFVTAYPDRKSRRQP